MSTRRRSSGKEKAKPEARGMSSIAPLKPRRGLFVALLIIFVIWVGLLLAMYFRTVFPQRHR